VIYLGLTGAEKADAIRAYVAEHRPGKVYVISPRRFQIPGWTEEMTEPETECDGTRRLFIDWPSVIKYRYYYRLLQEINGDTLVVINEGLRTQNRHDLAYNCIRNYLNQTQHVLVFNTLPIIDQPDDVMVLIDWTTRSRWRREPFSPAMLSEVRVRVRALVPSFEAIHVQVDAKTRTIYAAEKDRLLAEVRADGDKDPHVLPRNLALVSGRAKLAARSSDRRYLGRNDRFKVPGLETYREVATEGQRTLFELPHNVIDYADALAITRAPHAPVLVADLPADRWYFERAQGWARRARDAATALHG
jgi:hypothetical protein